MTDKNFRFEIDADGIALVTWDMPGRSMNVLNDEVVGELGQIVDRIASDAASFSVRSWTGIGRCSVTSASGRITSTVVSATIAPIAAVASRGLMACATSNAVA